MRERGHGGQKYERGAGVYNAGYVALTPTRLSDRFLGVRLAAGIIPVPCLNRTYSVDIEVDAEGTPAFQEIHRGAHRNSQEALAAARKKLAEISRGI
jgi:hypothetical protein